MLLLSALVLLLAACGSAQSQQPIPAVTVTLPPIGGLPPAASSLQPLGQLPPDATLQLSIGLAINQQALENDLSAMYNPDSPQFGHHLTPRELASQYGAPQATIDKVTAFLQAQGFQILSVSSLRSQISVSATVAQITQTFGVTLQTFNENGITVFAPSAVLTVPAALQGLITSVIGLSSIAQPNHAAHPLTAPASSAPEQPADDCDGAQTHGVTPNQTAATYGYTQAYKAGFTGKGVTIGVFTALDQAFSVDDVNTFLRCTTGGTLHRSVVKVDGGARDGGSGAYLDEAELDFEYLAALAPNAQLIEYQSAMCVNPVLCLAGQGVTLAQSFADVANQMAAEGRIQVASISLAVWEDFFTQDEIFTMNQAIETLAAEGVTVAIATGDCGAFGNNKYGQLSVDMPASAPYALAVGGTELQVDSQGHRTAETVWSDPKPDKSQCQNEWGSTGGLSKIFPQASWQQGSGVKNKYTNGKRQLPDVSAIAWKEPVYLQGKWYDSGGTSAATPIWAAGLALVDQGLMQHHKQTVGATPTFYRLANQQNNKLHPYYDITQGNNQYYPATTGFDLATGWGAPNLPDFGKAMGGF